MLDLRNNPGGLLTQAVKVSDVFIDSGLVVYTDGRLDNQQQKYFAHKAGQPHGLPDGRAGQRRQRQRVGDRRRRPAGPQARACCSARRRSAKARCRPSCRSTTDAAVRLTTARYYTPNGRSIQATGITPDIYVDNAPAEVKANGAPAPHQLRENNLPRHLTQPDDKPAKEPAQPAAPDVPDETSDVREGELGKDPQLDRALELLKSWNVFKTVLAQRPS